MRTRPNGFTLVELMVTLAVLAILVGFAVPAYNTFTRNQRLDAARDALLNGLLQARAEAVSRNKAVSLCASADGGSCLATADFASGWIVYEDGKTDDTTQLGTLIRREGGRRQVSIRVRPADSTATPRTFFRYTPTGVSTYGGTPLTRHVISICDPDNQVAPRALIIETTTGQVRTGGAGDADCS